MNVTIPCPCPPKADGTARHASDTVTLRDTLDFRTRLTLRQTVRWAKTANDDLTEGEVLAQLTEAYLLHCIDAWSLLDDKGKALPPSRANIREVLLEHDQASMIVADGADGLYSEVVLLPLLTGASKFSPDLPTDASTSPTTGGPTPQKPSKRSSTTTTPMAVTGPMQASPGGASSSLPS